MKKLFAFLTLAIYLTMLLVSCNKNDKEDTDMKNAFYEYITDDVKSLDDTLTQTYNS